jgi:hypothetical protein
MQQEIFNFKEIKIKIPTQNTSSNVFIRSGTGRIKNTKNKKPGTKISGGLFNLRDLRTGDTYGMVI